MYYNGFIYLTDAEASAITEPQAFGYFRVVDVFSPYNPPLERLGAAIPQYNEYGYYERVWHPVQCTKDELVSAMRNIQVVLTDNFQSAFVEIDAKTRPMRGALLSVVDGTFPTQAYNAGESQKDLTPEQQQRIIDVGIMWELEEVAQVNRDMQTELLALEITEDMTLEQAQEITLRIANAKPWLPWREAQKP